MGALTEIISYLLQTFLSLYLFVMLLRFLMQLARADFYNPISQFIIKVTNPLVLPLRKIIPGYAGVDLSSLLLALLIQMLLVFVLVLLSGGGIVNPLILLLAGIIGLVALILNFYFFAIIAMIIFSFVAPGSTHPAIYLIYQITEPVLAPFRKLIPSMGGFDFSPILVFILIRVLEILLVHSANALGVGGLALWLF
jgi:YggT family protein